MYYFDIIVTQAFEEGSLISKNVQPEMPKVLARF